LSARGAMVDGKNRKGETPLMFARTPDIAILHCFKVFRVDHPHVPNLSCFQPPAADHRPCKALDLALIEIPKLTLDENPTAS